MSKKEKILKRLEGMGSKSEEARNQAELYLVQTGLSKSDLYIDTLLGCLEDKEASERIQLTAVQFIEMGLVAGPANQACCLGNMSEKAFQQFKSRVIRGIGAATQDIRAALALAVGRISASLLSTPNNETGKEWDDIFDPVSELLGANEPAKVFSGLEILSQLCEKVPTYVTKHEEQFVKGMLGVCGGGDWGARLAALATLKTLLERCSLGDLPKLALLRPTIIEIGFESVKENQIGPFSQKLGDLVNAEAGFWRPEFPKLVELAQKAEEAGLSEAVVSLWQTIVAIVEQFPGVVGETGIAEEKIIQKIIGIVETEDPKVLSDWLLAAHSGKGSTRKHQSAVEVFVEYLNAAIDDKVSETVITTIEKIIQEKDPKKLWLGLVLFCGLSKFIDMEKDPIVDAFFGWIKPLRSDREGEVWELYLGVLVRILEAQSLPLAPKLIELCVEVVKEIQVELFELRGIRFEPFVDLFVRAMDSGQIQRHFSELMSLSVRALGSANPGLKILSFDLNGIFCEKATEKMAEHAENIYRKSQEWLCKSPTFRLKLLGLRQQALIVLHFADRLPPNSAQELLEMLVAIQNEITGQPQGGGLHLTLCEVTECILRDRPELLGEYWGQIFPNFLKVARESVDIWKQQTAHSETEEVPNPSELRSYSNLILLLLGDPRTAEWIPLLVSLSLKIADLELATESREVRVSSVFPRAIQATVRAQRDPLKITRKVVFQLTNRALHLDEPQQIRGLLGPIPASLEHAGPVLSDEDLVELVRLLLEVQATSGRRLTEAKQFVESQEDDPVQVAQRMAELQPEESQVTALVVGVIGTIFLIYQQRTLNLLAMLFSVFVAPFSRKRDPKQAAFVLGLIEVASRHLGAFIASESLSLCLSLTVEFAEGSQVELKPVALTSIGNILTVSKNLSLENCEHIIKILSLVINFGGGEGSGNSADHSLEIRDAAVASFGRLLKYQRHLLAKDRLKLYLAFWSRHLPVRSPAAESKTQSDLFLSEMLQVEDTIGLDNPDTLTEVVRVLTSIKNGPHADSEAREKAGMLLRKISERRANKL